jgi:predicted TIM-barrel fold metal-dependent hydrolase
MKMNEMVIISVDDHICEPPEMFDEQLSGNALATAPKLLTDKNGKNHWSYQGMKFRSVGLNAVVGRPFEEYGMEPTALDQLRKGCYNVHARIDDMDVNGIAASLNFGNSIGFNGATFHKAPDKGLALTHLHAYNDWHIEEWCGAYPDRFIPCAILPTWDMDATVDEVRRVARKGCVTVYMNENPTTQGLPSIHNEYWNPFWKAMNDNDVTIALHIGTGNPAPHASMETPIEAWITTMPMSIAVGAADWLQLKALQDYPQMRIALSEGSIGWVPYFLERADFSNSRHKVWTHSIFQDKKPSDTFKRHFLNCFIDDAFGLRSIKDIGEDMIAYECDYPHSDALWPEVPERLFETVQHLTDEQIDKVTHRNAMRHFRFDLFKYHERAELTVGALRAAAKARNVDIAAKSSDGDRPVELGAKRPVTSGDLMRMFASSASP